MAVLPSPVGRQHPAFEFLAAGVKSRSDATWQEEKASKNVEQVQGVEERQEVKSCQPSLLQTRNSVTCNKACLPL